ncbi:hypothetical protein CPB84DRAFT_1816775 [Gymnopilus junonius]|uniref:MYND-type domain-containing protein n=1 Tax=Gymnopilus junonius TaxID=109634 RepID=A0A9P5NGZ3_GYMJU|nr:hypothetical protein CPB84DRAFT_1816775 [Gymnopilus junonius]
MANSESWNRIRQMGANISRLHATGEGRSLEELKKTNDVLQGQESLRLRMFFTNNCMEPFRDLDRLGLLLFAADKDAVKLDYATRLNEKKKTLGHDESIRAAAQEYAAMRWGPTEVPIYNLLGLFTMICPAQRATYLDFARFFIEKNVPVDGKDLSGSPALTHVFSTKPAFDLEYAQILYDAGGDVNTRNRYGGIVAHEIATQALQWFLSHGGNLDIADGDGMTPRFMCERQNATVPALKRLAHQEDERRKLKGDLRCALCGRDGVTLLKCGRCKKAKYCDPKTLACQKLDWPNHKKTCKA